MKESELTFSEGFTKGAELARKASDQGIKHKAFDFDKAAKIIKDQLVKNPNLVAEAGLQKDWVHTGGVIFENGKPIKDNYTYLCSNWAIPTLIIEVDDVEILQVDCYCEENERFNSEGKWDLVSELILKN